MNPASGKCLGIAELTATDHLLEWEVVGEVLRLREADASVDIRLGNFFQDISSCFLASGLRSFWLCFLSHNDVVLRFRFQGGLAPLAEAMEGKCLHLNTELILANKSLLSREGCRYEVFYESLDLAAEEVISTSSWLNRHKLVVGLLDGSVLSVTLSADRGVEKTSLTATPLLHSFLSNVGLASRQHNARVQSVCSARDHVFSLSEDGLFRAWRLGAKVLAPLQLRLDQILDSSQTYSSIGEGAIMRCTTLNGIVFVALGFETTPREGGRTQSHAVLLCFDGAAAQAVLLSKADLVAPDAIWHLRDMQLVGGRSVVTVWSTRGDCQKEERAAFVGKSVFVYAINPDILNQTPVLGRRIDLPVYTRLAELLEEDLYLARRCPAETSGNVLFGRLFSSSRFSPSAILAVLERELPLALRCRWTGDPPPHFTEELLQHVASLCSAWAALLSIHVKETYLTLIVACSRYTLDKLRASPVALQTNSSGATVALASYEEPVCMLSIVLSETGQKTERANVLAPPIGHFQSAESMDVEAALSFAATSLDGEVVTNLRAEFQLLIAKNEDNAFDLAKVVVRDYVSFLPDTTKVHLRKLSENIRDLFSAVLLNPQSRESPSSAISLAVAHSKENDLKISIFLESARGWLSNQLSVALLACIVLDLEMNEQEDNGTLIHLFTAALLRALHISLYRFMDSKILSRKPVTLLSKPHVFSATGQRSESSAIHRSAAPPSVFQTFIEYLYDRHRVNDGNHAVIWSSELGCLSPYSALLSFLELKSLYSLLQRLADFLLSSARIFENGGGVDVAHWGTLKGRCCLLASAKSGFEDAESLSTAMSLLLSSPSHLPELSTDAPSPKLAASVYGWSEVLLRDKLTALHKDSVFTTVVSKYSLLDFLGTSILQQMLLVIIRVHHLQSVCELLRRVDAPHDCHIAALKFLAASLEEARQLFVSGNDSDIVIRLGEDLSTAWIALFQRYLYSDSWAECVNAMKYIDASKHEILVEELIETVCERGCLDWLCFDDESKDATHIPGTLQVALQLEKLHLVKDLPGKSVYFEAACVMLLLRKQYFEAARFAYAVYDRQLNGADSERSLRLTSLLLAALCLAALPSDLAYVLHRSTASSRKRVLGADDIKDRSSQLRFKTFKETSKELDIEYARSLISFKLCSDSPAHDALSLIHELFERDMRTEADHLAIKFGEYSALSRLIAEGSMDGDDLDSFDSPFGYFAGALGSSSSGAEEGEHNRADEYSCNSQKFWRLSLDGIVRSLVATGNLVEACKVFSERLQKTQDGQWIPYNALDNLLLNCSEALSTVDEGTVEPQLSSSHAYMLFALENHFRSLVAGI